MGFRDREHRPSYWSPKSGPICGFRPREGRNFLSPETAKGRRHRRLRAAAAKYMFWKIKDNGGLCCTFCFTFSTEKIKREEEWEANGVVSMSSAIDGN